MIACPDLTISRIAAEAHLLLHCEPGDAGALAEAAEVALDCTMLHATSFAAWHALHLAPDEWLLIGPPAEAATVCARLAAVPVAQSLVDISDRALGIEIAGPAAPLLLSAGCPLDLAEPALPVDACTRTLFGKASVMLWRTAAQTFRLEYPRSFDAYVTGLLTIAVDDVIELTDGA